MRTKTGRSHRVTLAVIVVGALVSIVCSSGAGAATIFPLYVSNRTGNSVEKFTSAGNGSVFTASGINNPQGIAFDTSGNLYVASASSNVIERFSRSGADLGAFASSGLANPQ